MMKSYLVYGWLSGSDYDAGKPADKTVKIRAKSESEADSQGDAKLKRLIGECAVVVSEETTLVESY